MKARALTLSLRPSIVYTTEVLIEYLKYFGGWGPNFRRKALTNVQRI
jgi:hypothetical protein